MNTGITRKSILPRSVIRDILERKRDSPFYAFEIMDVDGMEEQMEPLQTKDLCLRQMTLQDKENMYALTKEQMVAQYMHFSRHEESSETEEMIKNYLRKQQQNLALPYVVEQRETGEFVGVFVLKRDNKEEPGYSITAFFAPDSWGKGYLTQILCCVREYALHTLGMDYLEAYVVEENIGSCKGCLKAGFFLYQQLTFDDWDGVLNVYRINRDGTVTQTEKIHKED